MTKLKKQLTQSFEDLFALNYEDHPGLSYGIYLENVASDGSKLDLVLTFKSGVTYCCTEHGCHHSLGDKRKWKKLRKMMDANGLENRPFPLIRKLKVIIEEGAISTYGNPDRPILESAMEYETDRGYSYEVAKN